MERLVDESARVVESTVGTSEVREFVTIHDSVVGDGCRVYERASVKKSAVGNRVDVNAGSYVENARLESEVQVGPNCSVVGVTHGLTADGMTFRADEFDEVVVREGAFLGAGSVVGPGVEVGVDAVVGAGATVTTDVAPRTVVLGSPPAQERHPLADWLAD